SFHQDFTPLTEGFLYAKANDLESVKTLCEENKVAAIMFEVVQGEGGVLKLDEDFVQGVYGICKEKDILLIVDEVQTGNGRTGELYGYMHYGITPDIVTTAKGLGGGLPIGACLMGEKVEFTLGAGKHGSTFGGNPIACAGAINILSRLDDELLASVREKSEYIFNTLNGKKGVVSVSGLGLMVGIKLEKDTSSVIAKLQERGVLAIKAKDKLRLLPALNIPMELLQEAIDIIIDVVGEE
ncbi:MAG: aminotransferase class III-fold pyridoxal phosphate-dependent enzyme, partial [Clostridia bacterium]|nr:aminotransferase class III-fold pyridoxal phosphate-dependent enzyme [Clostridia bacterium]